MKHPASIFALSLCLVRPVFATSLPSYGIDISQTSVSGVSSGGAMAVQMDVAHSSIMRGVGVIAGVAYGCADPRLPLALPLPSPDTRVARGLACVEGSGSFGGSAGADFSIKRTEDAAAVPNHEAIDDPDHLRSQKVWLFSGYNDGTVRRGAMDSVAEYYGNYVNVGNVFYQTESHAPHALITAGYGIPCLDFRTPYINDCKYDAAGFLLKHIYGSLNRPNKKLTGSFKTFNQKDFVDGGIPALVGLAEKGYAYVPGACNTETCRVHIVFHGCQQYAGKVHDAVYKHAGYNKWADTNNLIVLYPQTEAGLLNPKGCWDWAGFYDALPNADFARKTGHQIAAIKAMLDHLAKGPPRVGGNSDTYGPPQNVQVSDTTSTSLALIWQPNSAAKGFNIYRSSNSNGTYALINNGLVSGASFGDQNLYPNTTYYYKISAVDGSNVESALTDPPVSGTTTSVPSGCDPYYSDNFTHWMAQRAEPDGLNAKAKGSGDPMGLLSPTVSTHLVRVGPNYYRVLYCQ